MILLLSAHRVAAFSVDVPSKGQEIDCKLQSNSS
jgi:hypothetical protein